MQPKKKKKAAEPAPSLSTEALDQNGFPLGYRLRQPNHKKTVAPKAARKKADAPNAADAPTEVWMPPLRKINISAHAHGIVCEAVGKTEHLSRSHDKHNNHDHDHHSASNANGCEGLVAHPRHSTHDSDSDSASASARQRERERDRGVTRRELPPLPLPLRDGGPMKATRHTLPAFKHRRELLDALSHPLSIVEGETGSGKTTQMAQYLLEEAAATGRRVNIICTQPRRIAAIGTQFTCFTSTKVQILTQKALIGVADRVAAERGERVGEGAVGYAVRDVC
jgi:hypothetical protein